MKYIVVLGDGMADEPLSQLGGKTPLDQQTQRDRDGAYHSGGDEAGLRHGESGGSGL